jgi:hypothetical protein
MKINRCDKKLMGVYESQMGLDGLRWAGGWTWIDGWMSLDGLVDGCRWATDGHCWM